MRDIDTLSLVQRTWHLLAAPFSVPKSVICTFWHVFPYTVAQLSLSTKVAQPRVWPRAPYSAPYFGKVAIFFNLLSASAK